MVTIRLESQISVLKIVDIFLLIIILLIAFLIAGIQPCSCTDKLIGELNYLSNISEPDNASVGVWIRISLSHPESALPEKTRGLIFESEHDDNYTAFMFDDAEKTLNKGGYLIEYNDKNGNGLVDTGDVIHLWGRNLSGYGLAISVSGYSGSAQVIIP